MEASTWLGLSDGLMGIPGYLKILVAIFFSGKWCLILALGYEAVRIYGENTLELKGMPLGKTPEYVQVTWSVGVALEPSPKRPKILEFAWTCFILLHGLLVILYCTIYIYLVYVSEIALYYLHLL